MRGRTFAFVGSVVRLVLALVLAVAPLLALMVFLGFYPKPLTDVITPAVDATMQDAGFTDPAPTQGDGEPAAAPTR